jgi:hypothetical protein
VQQAPGDVKQCWTTEAAQTGEKQVSAGKVTRRLCLNIGSSNLACRGAGRERGKTFALL